MTRRAVAALLAIGLVAGCGSSSGSGNSTPTTSPTSAAPTSNGGTQPITGSITVYADATLTKAFTTLRASFGKAYPGTAVTARFAPSSALATAIQQGAPADVFAGAAPSTMELGADAIDPQTFTTDTAEIAVRPKNPAKIKELSDLGRRGVTVAVCAPTAPGGAMAARVFANVGVNVTPSATATDGADAIGLVTSGRVKAALVYASDVRTAGTSVKGVTIPTGDNVTSAFQITQLRGAKNAPAAQAWVQYVRSATGQQALAADGFIGAAG